MKIKEAFNYAIKKLNENNILDYKTDVEIIFSHLFNIRRNDLILKGNENLSEEDISKLDDVLKKRISHMPVSEIFHETEFFGLRFKVTKDVLTPRSETELVLAEALDILEGKRDLKILDLCTGSGILGICIKKEHPDFYVTMSDISDAALDIARFNAKLNSVDVNIVHSDMFKEINDKFDLIISNPPYIPETDKVELSEEVLKYDPNISLFGGVSGLDFYKYIGEHIDKYLNPLGSLVLEIGYNQGEMVKNILLETNIFSSIVYKKDYSKLDRIVVARK